MKKIIVTTLLVLPLILTGCFGNQLGNQNTNQPVNQNQNVSANENINTVPTTTEEIDTSDWKTYRNEEYGFEFKYPGEWVYYNIVKEKDDGRLEYIYDQEATNKVSFMDEKLINKGLGAPVFTVSIKEFDGNLQSYIESNFNGCDHIKDKKIDELEFVKIKCEGYAGPNYYAGKKDEKIYTFSSFGGMNNYLDVLIESLNIK